MTGLNETAIVKSHMVSGFVWRPYETKEQHVAKGGSGGQDRHLGGWQPLGVRCPVRREPETE